MTNKPTQFVVFIKGQPKRFKGILGEIELHPIHILLEGGTQLLEETVPSNMKSPVTWYSDLLKEQEIHIKRGWKEGGLIWLQADSEKVNLAEFATWSDISSENQDELAWRTFWYPCKSGTTQEALGFLTPASQHLLGKDTPVSKILQTILQSSP